MLDLITDLHVDGDRQGPGSAEITRRALALAGLGAGARVADIGCGTGAASLLLAGEADAKVTAVDFLPAFLDRLQERAAAAGLGARITPLAASMEALPFEDGAFDGIWSEGAIYNMGFEAGISAWRRFLRPGGVLAVSELTWLTSERPEPLTRHWEAAYPEVAKAGTKIAQLEAAGYTPLGYIALPQNCWLAEYYRPMQARFAGFLARHPGSEAAELVAEEEREIALYQRYADYVSYGFYIARRLP